MSLLDEMSERDRELRDFEAREKRRQEMQEKLLALLPVLVKTMMGEARSVPDGPTNVRPDATDADGGVGYRDNVISITRAREAQQEQLLAQAFKKIDGMSGEEIAQLLQSPDPHERRMFKRLFEMYCEWKGKKA